MGLVQKLVLLAGQILQHGTDGIGIRTLPDLDHLVIFPVDRGKNAVDPGVVLIQLFVLGDEELGDLQKAHHHHSVEHKFALADEGAALLLAEGKQLRLGVVRKIVGAGEGLHKGLVT